METIFNKDFWINEWENDKKNDTFKVHKGFSTPEYWDKAALTYDSNDKEVKDKRLLKTMSLLREKKLLFKGMTVLDIGCGTGMLAKELAQNGARVTALDFSKEMLAKFKQAIPSGIKKNISIHQEDWHKINIKEKEWEKKFDLVIAFMSPGVARPDAFLKLMRCSKKGCAIRGWASKRNHPILSDLWGKIMKTRLVDKPQSILYKINLLFSLGIFPEITFDKVEWDQTTTIEQEFFRQMAFFKNISPKSTAELEIIIHDYLGTLPEKDHFVRRHQGLTATAVWTMGPDAGLN